MEGLLAIVVGIDEAGYGPRLGPLVVTAVAFEVERPEDNLWDLFRPVAVKEASAGDALIVRDSKKLFSRKKGIAPLERTAVAFLGLLHSFPRSFRELLNAVALHPEEIAWESTPWYRGSAVALPFSTVEGELRGKRSALKAHCEERGIAMTDVVAQYVAPQRLNRLLAASGNKATVLFDLVGELVRRIIETHREERDFLFRIGKQGGKNYYMADIVRSFSDAGATIVREGKEESRYRLSMSHASADLHFLIDGEEKSFAIALASVIGKYLREAGMRHFNAFWRERVEGIAPTAGYLPDADRFLAAIRDEARNLNLHDAFYIRMK